MINFRIPLLFLAILSVAIFMFGCGSNPRPTDPGMEPDSNPLTGNQSNNNGPADHLLLGFWQCVFNPDTAEIETVSLRETQLHLNIINVLQPPFAPGIGLQIDGFDLNTGTVDVNISITHPFPNSDLRIFDVRGIVMGAGDLIGGSLDPSAKYPAPSGFRVENADGYTRWWNSPEFITPGFFGFSPSAIGVPGFMPQATLNGYKYYCDALGPNDSVALSVSMYNRGTFSTTPVPPTLSRNFQLRFPKNGSVIDFRFMLAVDANWALPTGASPPPKPIGDFPIEANCPEAYHVAVNTEGTTAWYENETSFGGDIMLAIEVFDWGAPSNPDGINGEIGSIWVESPTLFDSIIPANLDPSPGTQNTSGIYVVCIPSVHPTGVDSQEILVTVRSSDPSTYAPPGIQGYPQVAVLASFALVEIPVTFGIPDEQSITVETPNGGENFLASGLETITWSSQGPVGTDLEILYSLSDAYPVSISSSTLNDGSFVWDPVAEIANNKVRIIIRSNSDPGIFDASNNYFSITSNPDPWITLVSPNGGESLYSGNSETIKWSSSSDAGANVKLEYSIASGAPSCITTSTLNDGSYVWNPIPIIQSSVLKIIVTSLDPPFASDQSDNYFSISSSPPPCITLETPNGGQTWQAGDSEIISWLTTGNVGAYVKIEYRIGTGSPTTITTSTLNDGSYMWNPIPEVNSNQVGIIITSNEQPSITDQSDFYFTITIPATSGITVTDPNGGEVWNAGESRIISWTSTGDTGTVVKIQYRIGTASPEIIELSVVNDGNYLWDPIPGINSHQVKVIITSYEFPDISDDSNAYFTINFEQELKTIEFQNWVALDYDQSVPYYSGPSGYKEFSMAVIDDLRNWTNILWNQYGIDMVNDGWSPMTDNVPYDHAYYNLDAFEEVDEMHARYGNLQTPDKLNVYWVQTLPYGYDTAFCAWPESVDTLFEHQSDVVFIVISPNTWYWEEVLAHEGGHAFGAMIDEYLLYPDYNYWCDDLYEDIPPNWQYLYCQDSACYPGNLMWFSLGWPIENYNLTSGQAWWVQSFHNKYPNNW